MTSRKEIFAVFRISPDEAQQVLCLQNVTAQDLEFENPREQITHDLLSGDDIDGKISLKPYQIIWLGSSK